MPSENSIKNRDFHNDTGGGLQRQQEMLATCDVGDVQRLQQLLDAAGVKKGDDPVEPSWESYPDKIKPVPESGPPATSVLLAHAVMHASSNVLALILETYPTAKVDTILTSAFAHPDLPTFKRLHARDPSIVNHEFESGETALMAACRDGSGNPLLPSFLLDNGADPNGSGMGLAGPLMFAVQYGQPLSLVKKAVKAGAQVRTASVCVAIRECRFDVVKYFLGECAIEDEENLEKYARKDAEDSGYEEVVTTLEKRVRSVQKVQAAFGLEGSHSGRW